MFKTKKLMSINIKKNFDLLFNGFLAYIFYSQFLFWYLWVWYFLNFLKKMQTLFTGKINSSSISLDITLKQRFFQGLFN